MEKAEEPEELDKQGKTDAQAKHPGEVLSARPCWLQPEASSASERTVLASQTVSAAVPHCGRSHPWRSKRDHLSIPVAVKGSVLSQRVQ